MITIETIIEVFRDIDKDLLDMLGEKEYEEHIVERSLAFWVSVNKINKYTFCDEFMEK